MLKKLLAKFFQPPIAKIPVRMEHNDAGIQALIIVWSDDKKTQLASFPDSIDHVKLDRFLKEHHYEPVEYFINTY